MTTVAQVHQLALIASNQDSKVADLLCQIYDHETLTMNSISIGGGTEMYHAQPALEFIEGYSFNSGYLSPYFAGDGTSNASSNK